MLASDTNVRELVLNECVTEKEKCVAVVEVNDSLLSQDFCWSLFCFGFFSFWIWGQENCIPESEQEWF